VIISRRYIHDPNPFIEPTYYRKRSPEDSRLIPINLAEQFDFAVSDQQRYPAFRFSRASVPRHFGERKRRKERRAMRKCLLQNREIGPSTPPFIIAEMSGNHNQSLDRALRIVDAAANAGVHALKLQTYTADTLTLDVQDGDFYISDEESLWKGNSLHKLYQQAFTPWEWHKPVFERCGELGLICFSTPFDESSADFLKPSARRLIKSPRLRINHYPLIRKVAATESRSSCRPAWPL
jgi:hypothetical protein